MYLKKTKLLWAELLQIISANRCGQ